MDNFSEIMKRLREITGRDIPTERMSDEEYARFKCDSYNQNSGTLNEIDGYNCDKCKNKGYIAELRYYNGDYTEVHCECSCQKIRRTILRLMKSGLRNVIKDYTFDKYTTEEPWQQQLKARAFLYAKNPDGAWFFIGGQSGAGKTHLCTAIAGEMLKAGKQVRYMLWRDDVNRLKGCITNAEEYNSLIDGFKNAEVLYIDDLFKNGKGNDGKVQAPTGADVQTAFEILNYRTNNKKLITIISSERSVSELIEIDEAIAGRIAEMSFNKGYGFNIKSDRAKNYRLKNLINL